MFIIIYIYFRYFCFWKKKDNIFLKIYLKIVCMYFCVKCEVFNRMWVDIFKDRLFMI